MDKVTSIAARLGGQRVYAEPGGGGGDPNPSSPAPAIPRMREISSTVLELTGITVLVAGCYLIAPWVGLIVAGLCLILLGVATGLS